MADRFTTKIELVETHNLALSLNRLCVGPYDTDRWKRAFYHALTMSNAMIAREDLVKIREALRLP